MTKQEAQKIRSAFCNGFEYPFGQGGFLEKCDMTEVEKHVELLDAALQKQVPERPLYYFRPDGSYYILCPRCKQAIGGYRLYSPYCSCCGQALEWKVQKGEENERP